MTFIWPSMLITLLIVPVIVAVYWRVQRRRLARAAGFAAFGDGHQAARGGAGSPRQSGFRRPPGFRRHVPPLLFLLSLVTILVALARPQAQISLPRIEGTVMLVMDVSGSMAATDAEPTRLEAAKKAAREFVLSQPATVQIGIVSFSSSGFTVQAPTNDANSLLDTIARLEPASGTSLGLGILTALNAIAVDAGLAPRESASVAGTASPPAGDAAQPDAQGAAAERRDQALLAQLPEGRYPAALIVLLTDGEQNESLDPRRAAEASAEHGVRLDALGFGTPAGMDLDIDGFRVHTSLDEATLQAVTQAAGGTYYATRAAENMQQVYANLRPELVIKPEAMEVTAVFAGAGAAMMLVGSLLSMLWFNRLV